MIFCMIVDRSSARLSPENNTGHVCLVGAGPGDPELLTLKAMRALERADVVLHDNLVSPGVLALANPLAELIAVGKKAGQQSVKQDHINATLISIARAGKYAVRLKSGDPGIFGRAGEEVAACQAAGVPVSIIPGITVATAAAASLSVSLTHRDHARRVQFITGHSRDGLLPHDIHWASIADPYATTVLYMGVRTVQDFARQAIAAGLAPDTPVVAMENVSCANERVWRGPLSTLAAMLQHAAPKGPVVMLMGTAVRQPPFEEFTEEVR
jgi:uroporphyrin-III C-methyltransferase/precorrin-2 dehydrogenase/sirohydrochlorin ferrochelatase